MSAILPQRYIHVILIILIAISGFFVYANSLSGDFLWDDEAFVINNAYVKDWSRAGIIFTGDSGAGASVVLNFYRPLQVFSCLIDYSFWGLNPFGYHLTCVILHILVALAVYFLLGLLFSNIPLAFFSAILFCVHPVNSEAVAYISGRADLLSALFILLCLVFYIKNTRSRRLAYSVLVFFACLLAFLSKENSLIIVPLILLYHYIFGVRVKLAGLLAPLAISIVYLCFRFMSLKSFFLGFWPVARRVPGFFAAIAQYLRLLFAPYDLHMDYGNAEFSAAHPLVLCGMAAAILLIAYAFKRRKSDPMFSFAVFWFFIALLPVNSVYPANSFYMAEHWLYLPGIGFFLLLGRSLHSLSRGGYARSFSAIAALAFIFCGYSYLTVKQNPYWESPMRLYRHILKYTPGSFMVHNNMGRLYSAAGNKSEAANEFFLAVKYNPEYLSGYCSLLNIIYGKDSQPDGQDRSYLESVEANPVVCSRAYYLVGNAFYERGENEKSMRMMRRAIHLDPFLVEAYNNLASGYADRGDVKEAILWWEEAVRIKPDFAAAHFNLSVYYFNLGEYGPAIRHCDEVLKAGFQVDPAFLKELDLSRSKISAPPLKNGKK
jgi:tetratricopeptide (TPR) repeat protein